MKECPAEDAAASSSEQCRRRGAAEDGGDGIKCTGQSCKSCTAGVIADCVAVCCCCPCAVVNILVFALLKVPWMVGKRILRRLRRDRTTSSRRKKGRKKKCCSGGHVEEAEEWEYWPGKSGADIGVDSGMELPGFGEADQQVWFELHQFGHLGFGRVSFTGIQI